MKNLFLATAIAISVASGAAFADNGHGTHTPGTIAAVGNNDTAIGGDGRDVLVGGLGSDHLNVAAQLLVMGLRYVL